MLVLFARCGLALTFFAATLSCSTFDAAGQSASTDRVYRDNVIIPVETTIFFERGSAVLNQRALEVSAALADWLHKLPNVRIEIRGHAQGSGSLDENLQLSVQRVRRVYDILVLKGVRPDQIVRISSFGGPEAYGPHAPESENRVEIIVE